MSCHIFFESMEIEKKGEGDEERRGYYSLKKISNSLRTL